MAVTLASQVYSLLKDDIFEGTYFENDLISEQQIADKFGVSKTTAREGLLLLCKDGLLNKVPNRGYFVKRVTKEDYQDMLNARYLIEIGAVQIIIDSVPDSEIIVLRDRISDETFDYDNFYEVNLDFHTSLVGLAKNSRISAYHRDLMCFLQRPGQYRLKNKPLEAIAKRHLVILDALLERDLQKTVRLLWADILD